MNDTERKDKVFLVDICGTIFKSNTTFDFVKYMYGNKLRVKFFFSLPYRIYNRIMDKLFHKEPLRRNLIAILKGNTIAELEQQAESFYTDYLKSCENEEVINIIEKMRQQGMKLVIVSATISPIAKVVARHLKIDTWLSTILSYSDSGICVGTIRRDLLKDKKSALSDIGLNAPYEGIITDNYSDKGLIELSEIPFLVTYNRCTEKWKKQLTKETISRCTMVYV